MKPNEEPREQKRRMTMMIIMNTVWRWNFSVDCILDKSSCTLGPVMFLITHTLLTALSRVKRDNQRPGLGRRLSMLPAASVKCLYINVAFILCYTQIPFTVSLNSCLGSGIFMALNQVSIKGEGENGTRSRDLC